MTFMGLMRTYILKLVCLLIGISFIGCSYAGYYIGNRIDNASNQKIVFQQTSMSDSNQIAIAKIPLKSKWNVHLRNRDIFSATFEGTNSTRDTLIFQINSETRNVSASNIDYIAEKNFMPATKFGSLLGLSIDVVVIVEVVKALTAKKYVTIIE